MHDAIVIGGGVLGAATAYHLVRAQARVLLLDRGDEGRATAAGAGIVSPATYRGDSDVWYRFSRAAYQHLSALVPELEAEGAETGFSHCGLLLAAVSEDEFGPFEAASERILSRPEQGSQVRSVEAAEAREMFPPLAPSARALHNPDAARIDGRLLARALLEAAERRGLERRTASVDSLILEGGRVAGVLTGGDRISAGTVVIAGGAWSRRFSEQLGLDIPVAPQRGQIIHLDLGGTDTSTWPIVSAFRDHYMVPWPDSRVAVGATRETGSGFEPRVTAAGIVEVLSEALRVAPGLAGASIRETRVGLRPSSADGMPVMGAVRAGRASTSTPATGPADFSSAPSAGGWSPTRPSGQCRSSTSVHSQWNGSCDPGGPVGELRPMPSTEPPRPIPALTLQASGSSAHPRRLPGRVAPDQSSPQLLTSSRSAPPSTSTGIRFACFIRTAVLHNSRV